MPVQQRRRAVVLAVFGAAMAGAGFLSTTPRPAAAEAENVPVELANYKFSPARTTVKVGDTVVWKVTEGVHTITADDGSFDSADRSPGQQFTFTFDRPGTFAYSCQYDRTVGMTGVIKVREAEATSSTSSSTTSSSTTTTTGMTTTTMALPPLTAAAAPATPAPTSTTATSAPATSTSTSSSSTSSTTTSTTAPAEAAPAPADDAPPPAVPGDEPTDENAATAFLDREGKPYRSKAVVIALGVVLLLLLGAGVWAWWHRSSRYTPA